MKLSHTFICVVAPDSSENKPSSVITTNDFHHATALGVPVVILEAFLSKQLAFSNPLSRY